MSDSTKAPKTIIHLSDLFTESDEYMNKRVENALKTGRHTGFWEEFFFCNKMHLVCKKFFYLFTEQQLVYLKNWWEKKIAEDEETKEALEISVQNCFSKIRRMENDKVLNIRTYCIRQEPSGKNKISFILKLVKVVFKLPENNEKSVPKSPNFFIEKWTVQGKIAKTPDERRKYMEELLFTTLTNKAAVEIFGKLKSEDIMSLYLGDDCGYDHPSLVYCDKFNDTCPFYDVTSSTE